MKTTFLVLALALFMAAPTKPVGPPVPGPGPIPVPGPCKHLPLPGEPCRN